MNKQEILDKVALKKGFSQLPRKDIELAFSHFEKRQTSDEEKIRLTRDLLRKVFSAFASEKLLFIKDKDSEWILRKHLSTRERLVHYSEIYKRTLKEFDDVNIIDLGAGVNGFSYGLFPKNLNVNYLAFEAVGQLVNLMNFYFKQKNINGKAIHESLFELEKIKKIIEETKKPRVVFLFKVLDSLEMLERDYSKKLLFEIAPLADKIIVSFATRSMNKREKFKVKRNWIINFIKEKFILLEDFQLGNERYIIFKNRE